MKKDFVACYERPDKPGVYTMWLNGTRLIAMYNTHNLHIELMEDPRMLGTSLVQPMASAIRLINRIVRDSKE